MKEYFLLDPNITFLNFGSFGACSKKVFQVYQNFQLELEQSPVQFITVKGIEYVKKSRIALAEYVNCNEDDLVLIPNPTYGVNVVAKNLDLQPNDEILTTNIEYGACDRTWQYYCEKAGAKYIRQPIHLPLENEEEFVSDLFKGVTSKTKLIFISHITSSTALIFPIKKVIEKAKQLGLKTFIDGAHVPGHIALDLQDLDADYYTAACHKWMMTPKGSSFLYVRKELQNELDPLIFSWGYKAVYPSSSQFIDYHQFTGTRDFSAFCTIPTAIEFMQENQWHLIAANCRQLVYDNAERFTTLLQSYTLAPLQESYIAQMLSVPIKTSQPEQLKKVLYDKYQIEVPIMRQEKDIYLRYSINAFNSQEDLDILYNALIDIMKTTGLIEV